MRDRKRLRRVAILCCHCLKNLAFYFSWYEAGKPPLDTQFKIYTLNNFLDIAVLEWCKLLVDKRSKHYFAKVVPDHEQFMAELLSELAATETAFNECIEQMRTYRDKFVAHLDDVDTMQIPAYLALVQKSTTFLYDYLLAKEANNNTFHDAPNSAKHFYDDFLTQGKAEYEQMQGRKPHTVGRQ